MAEVARGANRLEQWLFDNGVYPIVYPLPRRERMVEDHHRVIEQAALWARVPDTAAADR